MSEHGSRVVWTGQAWIFGDYRPARAVMVPRTNSDFETAWAVSLEYDMGPSALGEPSWREADGADGEDLRAVAEAIVRSIDDAPRPCRGMCGNFYAGPRGGDGWCVDCDALRKAPHATR